MNNYHDQSENEPTECPACYSAMTEVTEFGETFEQCDNMECTGIIKGESNE